MEDQKTVELDFRHIAKLLLKKWWLILAVAVVFATVMFAYMEYFVEDTYTVKAQIGVSNVVNSPNLDQYGMSSSDVTAATSLVDTYCVILKNDHSLKMILNETGLGSKYSTRALKSMITAGSVNESLILEIRVTATNPQDAQAIANAATKVLEESEWIGASATPLYQVDAPNKNNPDSKGTSTKMMIAFAAGAALMALILIVLDLRKDTIRSDEWLKEKYGDSIPLLAIIPNANRNVKNGRKKYGYYARYGYYTTNQDQA